MSQKKAGIAKITGLAEDIVETLREPILVLDKRLRIIAANPSFYRTFQVSEKDTLNQLVFELGNDQWDIPQLRKLLEEIIPRRQNIQDFKVDHGFEKLGRRTMLLNAKRIVRKNNAQPMILLAIEDVTDRKRLEDELQKAAEQITRLSLTDELTSLYNRRGFLRLAHQQMKLAERLKQKMCLFFIDLNGLKRINDRFGHRDGDQALAEFAKILQTTFRESDIVSRFGGDEFVVFGFGDIGEGAEHAILRIEKNLAAHYAQAMHPYALSVSVGVAQYDPASPRSISELLAQADKRMYENKRRRKK